MSRPGAGITLLTGWLSAEQAGTGARTRPPQNSRDARQRRRSGPAACQASTADLLHPCSAPGDRAESRNAQGCRRGRGNVGEESTRGSHWQCRQPRASPRSFHLPFHSSPRGQLSQPSIDQSSGCTCSPAKRSRRKRSAMAAPRSGPRPRPPLPSRPPARGAAGARGAADAGLPPPGVCQSAVGSAHKGGCGGSLRAAAWVPIPVCNPCASTPWARGNCCGAPGSPCSMPEA